MEITGGKCGILSSAFTCKWPVFLWMNCCHVFVIIKVASFFRLKLQAKPEAGKLMIGTVALLIAATSSILVVCFFYYLPLPVPLSHTVTKISVSMYLVICCHHCWM